MMEAVFCFKRNSRAKEYEEYEKRIRERKEQGKVVDKDEFSENLRKERENRQGSGRRQKKKKFPYRA